MLREELVLTNSSSQTYSNQWTWDDSSVVLTAATVQAVQSAGQSVAFVFEFFPRTPGNSANYTLTV